MGFNNVYEDAKRAESYSKLEFPGTYYLAYRDIPEILAKHVKGKKAVDFGCGTGRSTRFLKKIGFDAVGVDISQDMINIAKKFDSDGKYYLINEGDLKIIKKDYFDLILSVFTFDNIPCCENRLNILKELASLLINKGIVLLVDSTPEIYINEWASFSTKDFPENKKAKSGDTVKIIMTDVDDKRPVEDIIWFNEDYLQMFEAAKLELIDIHKPLGRKNELFQWINETKTAPWIIYVLRKK